MREILCPQEVSVEKVVVQHPTGKNYLPTTKDHIVVALAGNPNAGKTTLFNALTGLRQKVANYTGVTVERKEGIWRIGERAARLVDLPGLYSLEATSLDEQIARDVLTGKVENLPRPDVIIAVVDATNLERNLYLVTQLLDYEIPVVIALTMIDSAENARLAVDAAKLTKLLAIPVVAITASSRRGLEELTAAVNEVIQFPAHSAWKTFKKEKLHKNSAQNSLIFARYAWISEIVQESALQGETPERNFSEKLDRVLTHKFFGLLILAAILLIIFQAIFSWARIPMDLLDYGVGALGDLARTNLPEGILTDLLSDGIIAGVGGVLVFLPQILLLFFFISILEDTGYMARAAFLLDRLMRGVGLHGKAFVPLLSSFACAIPGIMATRTIESPKDRLTTILIAPLMSCSARLPVYTVMIAAFFSGQYVFGFLSVGALLILSMYLLGIVTALILAFIFKRTILKSPAPPLVLELPSYRLPSLKNVLLNMFQNGWQFVKRAGTVILAISILLWALTYFPRYQVPNSTNASGGQISAPQKAALQLQHSYAGQLGHFIEPVIRPLGFDWKIGIGLIASFGAREVVISTMSIIYNAGDTKEADDSIIQAFRDAKRDDGTPEWTPLTALSLMVFFVLAMQCMSTVAVVRRETNSWKWTFFMVAYMTGLAYFAALITYQSGKYLGY